MRYLYFKTSLTFNRIVRIINNEYSIFNHFKKENSMLLLILLIALIIFSIIFLKNHFKKVKQQIEENYAKAAELDPSGKTFDKKHRIATYIGIGLVALIPIIMLIAVL